LFLAGERSDPPTLQWAEAKLGVPVIDHWWQTETGWAIAANCLGIEMLPVKHGSPTRAAPGWDVRVLGDDGHPAKAGEPGREEYKECPAGTAVATGLAANQTNASRRSMLARNVGIKATVVQTIAATTAASVLVRAAKIRGSSTSRTTRA